MQRRTFLAAAGATPLLGFTAERSAQEEPIVFHYWDVARAFADVIRELAPEQSQELAETVARALIASAGAVLAEAKEAARAAMNQVSAAGDSLWASISNEARDLGLDFDSFRQATEQWLTSALDTWVTTDRLPTLTINRTNVRCFFRALRADNFCAQAPVETLILCGTIGLVGVVAHLAGFMVVFGACLRRRVPQTLYQVIINCVRPAANNCLIGNA